VRERRKLAVVGIVIVALALSRRGEVVGEPQIAIDGVPYEDDTGEPMEDIVLTALDGTLRSIPRDRRRDLEMVSEAVRRGVRGAVANAWGKKPIVKVLLSVIEGKG
jgi:ribonuclease J